MNYNNDDDNNIFKQIQANILYHPTTKQTNITNDRNYYKNNHDTLGDRKYISNQQQQERIEARYYQTGKSTLKANDNLHQKQLQYNDFGQRPMTTLIKKNRAIREHSTIEHNGHRTPTRSPALLRKTPAHSPIRPKTPDYERRDNTRMERTPDGRIKPRKMNINAKELDVRSNYETKSPSRKMNLYTNSNNNENANSSKPMHTHNNSHHVNLTNGNNSHRNINSPLMKNNQGYNNNNNSSNSNSKGYIKPPNNPIPSNRSQFQYQHHNQQHHISEMRKVSSYSKMPIQSNSNTKLQQYQNTTNTKNNSIIDQNYARNANGSNSYYQSSTHKKVNTTLNNNTITTTATMTNNQHTQVFESFGKPLSNPYPHPQIPHKQSTISIDQHLKKKEFQMNSNNNNHKTKHNNQAYSTRSNASNINNYNHNKSNNNNTKPTSGLVNQTYQLPEEDHRIDFNELDQFSPPYTGGNQLGLNYNNHKITSTYSNIIEQRKEDHNTLNPSLNNRQIINDFVSKISTKPKKYSTIEYQKNDFDFHRKTSSISGAKIGIAPSNYNYNNHYQYQYNHH